MADTVIVRSLTDLTEMGQGATAKEKLQYSLSSLADQGYALIETILDPTDKTPLPGSGNVITTKDEPWFIFRRNA